MMPAATHFDPVVGVDVHMVQPSGPVPPVPIPHPYIGIVFDPFDYLPIIGSTVKVNGLHRAIAGTAGKALPKHFPIGGTFVPPLPADEHENFMGSSTVEMDGDAAAYMALPCLSCQSIGMPPPPRRNPKKKTRIESLVLPTSLVLPIPKGTPVLIGGAPTISLTSVALHLVGPLARAIKRSKPFRKGAEAFKKARRYPFRNMKPGFLKCKVLRAEPVDVVTGEVVVDQQDFELPGRIPIRWTRHYRSGSTRRGICGVGWETPADARLELGGDGVVFHDGAGVATYFDALPDADEPVVEPVDGGRLHRLDRHFVVEQKGGLSWYFEIPHVSAAEIRVAAIVDRCRNSLHFLRDGDGLREVVESAGRRLVCTSERGLLRRITLHHPDFRERRTLVRFAYDDDANLTAVHDALDHPYTFGWDDRHRLLRHTNRTGLSFYYEYDADSRCVHSWGDGGLHDYHFEYDPVGRFTNLTDSLGHPWTVEYDERQLITRETDPLGGVTSYAYDEVGRTVAVVDPAGRMVGYAYDDRGNLIELTRPDGTTVGFEFNEDDLPSRITGPNGAAWEQSWDERGLLVKRKRPLGAITAYAYDASGQLVGMTDPRGGVTRLMLDGFGLLVALADGLGNATRFAYDVFGKVASRVDPAGRTTTYQRDRKGRLGKLLLPSGTAVECVHDAEDNLVRFLDEKGAVTRLDYVGLNELKRHIQPDGHGVEYHYDSEERLVGVTNERGETYRLERDALGRIVKEVDYWGQARHYAYDSGGHLQHAVDPLGRTIEYTTDAVGRVRKKVLLHSERPNDTLVESFDFDAAGNLVRASNPHIVIGRRFDIEGRLLAEDQGGFEIRNTYDVNGNRILRETSTGNRVAFEYDALDRVSAVRINDGPPIGIERDRQGQVIREVLGGSLIRQYRYSGDGLLTSQRAQLDGSPLFDVHYAHDLTGNLARCQDSVFGADRYSYDSLGRILEHVNPQGMITRCLSDVAGDRLTTRTRQAATGHALGEPESPLLEWYREGRYQGADYRFDRAGNLVCRRDSGRVTYLSWDTGQRLVRSETDGVAARYGYDPRGRRVFKESDGRRTHFFWDGDRLLGEVSATLGEDSAPTPQLDERTREYVYYPDSFEPLALIESAERGNVRQAPIGAFDPVAAHDHGPRSLPRQVYYYHNAPNGCPTRLSDGRGRIVWTASYDTGGRARTATTNEIANPIRLQGHYEDSETGLHYSRSRYYDPDTCAFVSQDTLGLLGGSHLYRYAPNTLSWIDPYGTDCKSDFRDWVLEQVWNDRKKHPLRFLLKQDNGDYLRQFHRPPTRKHHDLSDHPAVIEAGHMVSKHSGEPELLAVQAAWENQFDNISGENKGVIIERAAIDIGGIPVELRTAQWWEDEKFLPKGTVAGALRTAGWSTP